MRHFCQKTWDSSVENGQQAKQSEIKHIIQTTTKITTTSKPEDLIAYNDGSVIKDQSVWGFTVKQGATIIHEDSVACTVSTSSLTMEVEAVANVLRWFASRGNSQTTHADILTDSVNLLQSEKWNTKPRLAYASMFDSYHQKFLMDVLSWTRQGEGKRPSR